MYLVHARKKYTELESNNYKSLQSFKAFYCGWIKEGYDKSFGSAAVVIGKVK